MGDHSPSLSPVIPLFTSSAVSVRRSLRLSGPAGAQGVVQARRGSLQAASSAEDLPRKVLILEPDEAARSLMEASLRRAGFEVILAASPEQALKELAVDRSLPDLVLAEADAEGCDGFSFCGQLRADQRTTQIPVLLLARKPELHHHEMVGSYGADDYLPKPMFLQDLVSLCRLKAGRPALEVRFESHTASLPIEQLVRALLSGVRSGHVELGSGEGRLSFRKGRIIDAMFQEARGEAALRRMLMFGEGEYTLHYGPALGEGTFSLDLQQWCRTLMPLLREFRRLQEGSVPLEARLIVDFQRFSEELPKLPRGIEDVVRLCDGFRSVRELLIECAWPELQALEAVTRLYGAGILVPEKVQVPRAPVEPRKLPRFFDSAQRNNRRSLRAVAAARAALRDGDLAPELLIQMEAFRIQPVIENPEPPSARPARVVPALKERALSLAPPPPTEAEAEAPSVEPSSPSLEAEGPGHMRPSRSRWWALGLLLAAGAVPLWRLLVSR